MNGGEAWGEGMALLHRSLLQKGWRGKREGKGDREKVCERRETGDRAEGRGWYERALEVWQGRGEEGVGLLVLASGNPNVGRLLH